MKINVFGREVEVHQVMEFMKLEELRISKGNEAATMAVVAFNYRDSKGEKGPKDAPRVLYRTAITRNVLGDCELMHTGDFSTPDPETRSAADKTYLGIARRYIEHEGWTIQERQKPQWQ